MSKTTQTRRHFTAKDSYQAKVETLRRKQVRKDKYLANTTWKES